MNEGARRFTHVFRSTGDRGVTVLLKRRTEFPEGDVLADAVQGSVLTLKRRIEDATGEEPRLAKTRQRVGAHAKGQNQATAAQFFEG